MEFEITMGVWGWLVLIGGSVLLGIVIQLIGNAEFGFEWIVTAIGAAIGAIVASEFVVGWQAYEPVFDGLALIPALLGGLVVGIVAGIATRYITGGTLIGSEADQT